MDENVPNEGENPVLHVLVIGFHHKKGCQVEYSFPPLVPGSSDESECPPGWKYLPTLALPDGSHNYEQDTVFFHLPSLTDPHRSVFGISCFRQIPVEKLKNRTSDITRGTVQKSVCVLSRVPLYGQIEVKMALITHAYFAEGDFTQVGLLADTYHHLNACISQRAAADDDVTSQQMFVGLSSRELVLHWRHKALLLFKLLLLERKVVFYKSPVRSLCSTILSLLSLHPGMIETGLYQSACIQPSRPMSPVPQFDEVRTKQQHNQKHQQQQKCVGEERRTNTGKVEEEEEKFDNNEQKSGGGEETVEERLGKERSDEFRRCEGGEEETRKKEVRKDGGEEECVDRLKVEGGGDDEEEDGGEGGNKDKECDRQRRRRKGTVDECGKEGIQDGGRSDVDRLLENDSGSVNKSLENDAVSKENGVEASEEMLKRNGFVARGSTNDSKTEARNKGRGITAINRRVKEERPIVGGKMEGPVEVAREVVAGGGLVTYRRNAYGADAADADDCDDDNCDDDNDDGDQVTIASLPRDVSVETLSGDVTAQNNMAAIATVDALACGLPLPLFTQGYLCLPYLSLPYLDLLSDKNVRGYVVGATNVLFKQKRKLADVLVEVDGARIEVTAGGSSSSSGGGGSGVVGGANGTVGVANSGDVGVAAAMELRRQLHPSTEDLRFADYLVRHVAPPPTAVAPPSAAQEAPVDVFVDGVGWEGGDEWLRNQFRVYLLCLLRTSLLPEGSREVDQFNASFVAAWRQTRSYQLWLQQLHGESAIWQLHPGHPFAGGQLSVADMKLRITHTMQNTEGGRKLNQAMVSTGRAVATTGRAVGGALSQAKGALSSWWSNLTTAQSPTEEGPASSAPSGGEKERPTENGPQSADGSATDGDKQETSGSRSSNVVKVTESVVLEV